KRLSLQQTTCMHAWEIVQHYI
ncbi:hypothetical protein ACN38_g11331, partial [Penicillium nordicum]